MSDMVGPKYELAGSQFTIQYMRRKGYSEMPRAHFHPHYELYYLMHGERTFFVNDKVYSAEPGDMIIVNPYDMHRTISLDGTGFERVLVGFSPDFAFSSSWKEQLPFPAFIESSRLLRFAAEEQQAIEQLLMEILKECKEQQVGLEIYVQALLTKLLLRIYRAAQAEQRTDQREHPMHNKISEIAAYMHEHFREDISLQEVAKLFYVSPSYLSRIFKRITGFHFREYLQYVRIKEGQKLLRETRDKVQTIAESIGFENIAHFNKTFKKITGSSPLRYRKENNDAIEKEADYRSKIQRPLPAD
ncbi:helix-turn-helix domain-containing protein [Paenibacillus sp. y28]|uniref:helix-turn-helix domain-containing protein n=1 Tax=Paenibacillus sp. y28 TaxID=3129110 RepID=UPI00301990AD